MAAAASFYGVRVGRRVGVFGSWQECLNNVTGVKGAQYKKFDNMKEAEKYAGIQTNDEQQQSKQETQETIKTDNTASTSLSSSSSSSLSCSSSPPSVPVVSPLFQYYLYSDGASRSNPGLAGCGGVLVDSAMKEMYAYSEYLGVQTNNVAEYSGVLVGLLAARQLNIRRLEVRVDSSLVVGQVQGGWKCEKKHLAPFILKIKALSQAFDAINFTYIPRAMNARADQLANEAIDRRATISSQSNRTGAYQGQEQDMDQGQGHKKKR